MNKEQFRKDTIVQYDITDEAFDELYEVISCDCKWEHCIGFKIQKKEGIGIVGGFSIANNLLTFNPKDKKNYDDPDIQCFLKYGFQPPKEWSLQDKQAAYDLITYGELWGSIYNEGYSIPQRVRDFVENNLSYIQEKLKWQEA